MKKLQDAIKSVKIEAVDSQVMAIVDRLVDKAGSMRKALAAVVMYVYDNESDDHFVIKAAEAAGKILNLKR